MNEKIGNRIKSARLLRGLSQKELASQLGVSKQMISKYENGNAMPASDKLIRMSKLFGVKVDYFFKSFQAELGGVNFRKKSKFSSKKIASLKEKIKIHLENYLWIEDALSIDYNFKNIVKDIKVKDTNDIEKIILKIRSKWNIGGDPIHNIIQLLEDKEIKVVELDGVESEFDGLATYVNDRYPVIVVNKGFPVERKRFTLSHELGHLLLNLEGCDIKQEEVYCNKFAAELLFPKADVIREFGGKRKLVTINELIAAQKKYGLSIEAIVYRLVDCGILSKNQQANFYKNINSNSELRNTVRESRFETPEVSERFEQLVYRALAQEDISVSKASSILGKSIELVKEGSLMYIGE